MDKNTITLIQRLKKDPQLAQQMLSSNDGQALMGRLTQGDGGEGLRQATAEAAKGNTKALSAMLSELMHSSEGAALIQRLGSSVKQQVK